ncbi:6-carboxyhexanoate--CoA ligase [Halalkalibacter lacteus]|uniref:6-carboxyhexanoate--CoA ligase n=1 Tax=Halalkalibacter lacteus TaxID=3090663 RepID=UPI002FC909B6
MQKGKVYSVRMRASMNGSHEQGGKHISGGEQLSNYENINQSIHYLMEKALRHSRGKPDFMQIQFEAINEPVKQISPLPIRTHEVDSVKEGQALAWKLLEKSGVPHKVIHTVYKQMSEYSNMRGAILYNIYSGERIDYRGNKGIRVSRMDWDNANFQEWAKLHQLPLTEKVKEALVLASKVASHPSTIAELCWSDDPNYMTGYVASSKLGYQRITKLKEYGDDRGCRIFFVDNVTDLNTYIDFLEKQPIFVQWEEENDKRSN